MLVSIIVCTHSLDNFQNLIDAVDSLLNQTHKEIEIIIVVDGNKELYERLVKIYDAQGNVKIMLTEESLGAFGAGNVGVKAAQGDVIAFLDDDAVGERRWIENLVDIYEKSDAISVGGKILPIWLSKKPDYFPEELGWLVGITHEGFADEKVAEVRNTFGPNMSFRRGVFEEIGLLNEKLGFAKGGTTYMQGAEPEFALRMKNELGKGVIYNPDAVVYHKIPPSKTRPRTLLRRAFYQGYSKALMRRRSPSHETLATEESYLKDLLFKYIPRRVKGIFSSNASKEMKQLSFLAITIISVGLGFLYGYVKR
ncbi:MAG TPA: glycosyltransferase [Dehalococcoidia bacterium]|nr:glycosyltransferase [Dehalococcoidia bacterium]